MSRKVIIDTDPGIDDTIAILLALSAPEELEILALTSVNGNVGIEKTTRNCFQILHAGGRMDIPVYRGSSRPLMRARDNCEQFHGDDGLGNLDLPDVPVTPQDEDAVSFLLRITRQMPGEITLVTLGPLTNIARALQEDPAFAGRVKELIIMGGAEHGGNMSPHAEFNFWTDPEAAKIVMAAGFSPVTMIGLDATSHIILTPALRELLYLINTPTSRLIHRMTRGYADAHWAIKKRLGCELCDVLTIGYLLDESVAQTVDAYVDVETQGLCDGASVVYRSKYYPEMQKNCRVAVSADPVRFFRLFFGHLFPDYADIAEEILRS